MLESLSILHYWPFGALNPINGLDPVIILEVIGASKEVMDMVYDFQSRSKTFSLVFLAVTTLTLVGSS